MHAWVAGLEPRKREKIGDDSAKPFVVALDGSQETVTVLGRGRYAVMAFNKSLDVDFNHAQRRAKFVGGVCDEIMANPFKVPLLSDIVDNEKGPARLFVGLRG